MAIDLSKIPESECDCATCSDMCKRPCWPTPAEAAKLIDLGHASKLMADWWCGDPRLSADVEGGYEDRTWILCGANPGRDGREAAEDGDDYGFMAIFRVPALFKGCAFHAAGKCALHGICKPLEGRLAHHERMKNRDEANEVHREIAKTWASDEGRAVVARWRALVSA